MTDKEFENQKARIKKIIAKWADVFELDQWEIVWYWTRILDEDEPATRAKTHGRWQYRHCTVEFFLPLFEEEKDDDSVEKTIIYELTHILLLPMGQSLVEDSEHVHEYTCVSLQRALIRAYLRGREELK